MGKNEQENEDLDEGLMKFYNTYKNFYDFCSRLVKTKNCINYEFKREKKHITLSPCDFDKNIPPSDVLFRLKHLPKSRSEQYINPTICYTFYFSDVVNIVLAYDKLLDKKEIICSLSRDYTDMKGETNSIKERIFSALRQGDLFSPSQSNNVLLPILFFSIRNLPSEILSLIIDYVTCEEDIFSFNVDFILQNEKNHYFFSQENESYAEFDSNYARMLS